MKARFFLGETNYSLGRVGMGGFWPSTVTASIFVGSGDHVMGLSSVFNAEHVSLNTHASTTAPCPFADARSA